MNWSLTLPIKAMRAESLLTEGKERMIFPIPLFCSFPKALGLQEIKEEKRPIVHGLAPHPDWDQDFFSCTKKKVACACFKCTYIARVQDLLIPQFNSAL